MTSFSITSSSNGANRVRVLVADRNLMSAQLLAQALEQERQFQVTVASNTSQMMAAGTKANVVVINQDLAGELGQTMRISRRFSERFPHARIVILMDNPPREVVLDAFRCGASGVFSRTLPFSDLLKCVDRVSQGEIWASRSEIDYLLSALRGTPGSHMIGSEDIAVLSKREGEVVRYAGEGLSNREIAERLGLSEHTVKNYIFRACEKIGVSNRVELLFYLLRQERLSAQVHQENGSQAGSYISADCHKAAEEGFPLAQLLVGLCHLEGNGAEKSPRDAYYWLTLAQKNAERVLAETRKSVQELRQSLPENDVQEMECTLAATASSRTPNLKPPSHLPRALPRLLCKSPSQKGVVR